MNPKKIYLNPKTLDGLKATDGEGKTMRVKTFASKNDAEYTDLSQVWHDGHDEMPEGVLLMVQVASGNGQWGLAALDRNLIDNTADFKDAIARWALAADLMPKGGGE